MWRQGPPPLSELTPSPGLYPSHVRARVASESPGPRQAERCALPQEACSRQGALRLVQASRLSPAYHPPPHPFTHTHTPSLPSTHRPFASPPHSFPLSPPPRRPPPPLPPALPSIPSCLPPSPLPAPARYLHFACLQPCFASSAVAPPTPFPLEFSGIRKYPSLGYPSPGKLHAKRRGAIYRRGVIHRPPSPSPFPFPVPLPLPPSPSPARPPSSSGSAPSTPRAPNPPKAAGRAKAAEWRERRERRVRDA